MSAKLKKTYEPPKAIPLSRAIGSGRCKSGDSQNDCDAGASANNRCYNGSMVTLCSPGTSQ